MRSIANATLILVLAIIPVFVLGQTAPSQRELQSYSGLLLAAHEGNVAQILNLAQEGADPNVRDQNRRTPVHVAAFASNDDALRALADIGADMNALDGQAYDVVTIAAVQNDPALMQLAIDLGNDPSLITSPYDGTALIAAAHLGHVEVVQRLIKAGAPLDHVNNLHWTATIEAVILGDGGPDHVAVLDALLQAGANRLLTDRNGVTPLEHAELLGHTKMVELLHEMN